jgi:hypothetical protein
MIILFVSKYFGTRNEPGYKLESNMEYLDLIETHYNATKYIETNFPNSTVLTNFPQVYELKEPLLGYVNKPIKAIFIGVENFDLNKEIYNTYLIYYSPQSGNRGKGDLLLIINNLNATLLKRFEKNGKFAEIYKID